MPWEFHRAGEPEAIKFLEYTHEKSDTCATNSFGVFNLGGVFYSDLYHHWAS
jgi:hypothetical protein